MLTFSWKAGALALAAASLVGVGAVGGVWLSSEQHASELKDAGDKLTACTIGRDNVLALVKE